MKALILSLERIEYEEIIGSDGFIRTIDFKARRREVIDVKPLDPNMEISWCSNWVKFGGPRGTEVVVRFVIAS